MTPDERRKAYYKLPSATRKEMSEMGTFAGFVSASGLNVKPGTLKNEKSPMPDMSCKIDGAPYLFELGEIVDEEFAEDVAIELKTQREGDGGAQEEPVIRMLREKTQCTYAALDAPVDLVLHYDKQYPFVPVDYLNDHSADVAAALKPTGPFSRVWVYCGWTRTILWKSPSC